MRSMHPLMTAALAGAAMFASISAAAAQTKLKVMVFPGLSNLPIFAAQHKDLFAKQGLAIDLLNTPNSDVLLRRARQRGPSDRPCRGRQRGGDGRAGQGRRRDRDRRR